MMTLKLFAKLIHELDQTQVRYRTLFLRQNYPAFQRLTMLTRLPLS